MPGVEHQARCNYVSWCLVTTYFAPLSSIGEAFDSREALSEFIPTRRALNAAEESRLHSTGLLSLHAGSC